MELPTVKTDKRALCFADFIPPASYPVHHYAALLAVIVVRLIYFPRWEIVVADKVIFSHCPLPACCVVVKPDPGKLSGSLQFKEQSVVFLWAVHGGQVGVRLSAVPLSFSPRLGAAHIVVLTKQVGRQNINPCWTRSF